MRVAIAGASGFVGRALVTELRQAGHEVVRLVRREANSPDEVSWDPTTGIVDRAALEGVQAGVNLSGAPLADKRWNVEYKREVRASRTSTARTLAQALVDVGAASLLQASAIGFYGQHHADDLIDESSPAGTDFLADVCVDWEAAALAAVEGGLRVAYLRTGLVAAADGGAFDPILRTLRLGVGGPLGSGSAWWSWISLPDEVRAIRFLLEEDIEGPVNLVSPQPVPNAQLIRAIGRELHRPALLPAPAIALKLALGEFADEVLASRRVVPGVLLDAGFDYDHPSVPDLARWLVADGKSR